MGLDRTYPIPHLQAIWFNYDGKDLSGVATYHANQIEMELSLLRFVRRRRDLVELRILPVSPSVEERLREYVPRLEVGSAIIPSRIA